MTCRDVLEAAGPAFIKWGQWAATRHDLFPPDFCAILELLHTQVQAPTFPHMWACLSVLTTLLCCPSAASFEATGCLQASTAFSQSSSCHALGLLFLSK